MPVIPVQGSPSHLVRLRLKIKNKNENVAQHRVPWVQSPVPQKTKKLHYIPKPACNCYIDSGLPTFRYYDLVDQV